MRYSGVCQVSPSADIFTLFSLVPFCSLQQLSMAPVNHNIFFLDIRNMSWAHSEYLFILLPFHKKIIFLLAEQKEFVSLNF